MWLNDCHVSGNLILFAVVESGFDYTDCDITMSSDSIIAFDPDLAAIWAEDPKQAIELAKLYRSDPEMYAMVMDKPKPKTEQELDKEVRDPTFTGGYYEITQGSELGTHCPVSLCVSTQRGYNVFTDVCCHSVYAIEDYDLNYPNPLADQGWKGLGVGRNCWDILQWMTYDIGDMAMVTLNGIHPTISKEGYLLYDREDSSPSRFKLGDQLANQPTTELPADLSDQYHTKNNILRHWVQQSLPNFNERLSKIECTGRYSGISFPSNIISFLNLEPQSETTLPRTIWNFVCGNVQMVPRRVLENLGLIFTLAFETQVLSIHMDLQLKDWVNPAFRVIDPSQSVQVRIETCKLK